MSDLGAIFHVKKDGVQYDAHAYTTLDECPEPNLKINFKGQQAYIKLEAKGSGDIPCYVKTRAGGLYQVLAATTAKKEIQIFVAKGSSPWFSDSWADKAHVVRVDESVSGQATVTCDGKITNTSNMFTKCYNLTALDLSSFNASNVNRMSNMFQGCSGLTTLDLSNLDTSNAIYMSGMFYGCYNLTTIKGVIDMKSCTRYTFMFENCPKLTGVKIKNPPAGFGGAGLSSSQYTIVS